VPYVTPRGWLGDVRWKEMHWVSKDHAVPGRASECVSGFCCQVCGERCPDDDLLVVANRCDLDAAQRSVLMVRSGGPLHRQCARLSFVACPHLSTHTDPRTLPVLIAVAREGLELVTRPFGRRYVEIAYTYRVVGSWTEVTL
jgi:hypothetical protein